MRIRLVLALIATLLGVLAGTPAQAARPALRVLTFNVCGNVCRHGEVGDTSANVAYRIYRLNASVTMLQELCYAQFLAIRSKLAPFGYAAVFGPAATGGQCDNDDKKHGKGF